MTVSLTTNQNTYNPGQVVQITLTLTNASKHNETILNGPSQDVFSITQNNKVEFWRSKSAGFVPTIHCRRRNPQTGSIVKSVGELDRAGGFNGDLCRAQPVDPRWSLRWRHS